MNIKKVILAALTVLALAGLLAACAEPAGTVPETTESRTEGTQTPTGTEPAPTDPVPSKPTEPELTDPKPSETEPTAPKPTAPAPTETEPEPTESKPTEPKPTKPEFGSLYTRAELEAMDTQTNTWGPGVNRDEENRPYGSLNEQKKFGQYEAYFIAPSEGQIYLTFDEGYENGFTPLILDVLKEKNVKAVFFVTMPYCKSNPELVRRMIDEGHAVGNHSVHHKSMPTLSIDDMVREVMELHDYVREQFGYEMHLFRPPMGDFSQQSLAVIQNLGYKTVQWSFAYYDYEPEDQMEPSKAFQKVIGAAHEGAIYLLHAISETNTEILGDVIDDLRSQGYRLERFE